MKIDKLKNFIKAEKKKYRKIRYVECPALDNEKIYFTDKGFTHLLRKGRELRPIHVQIKRIRLLKYAIPILKDSTKFHSYRIRTRNFEGTKGIIKSSAQFWSFEKVMEGGSIIVVVCQINKENKHFLSIMDQK